MTSTFLALTHLALDSSSLTLQGSVTRALYTEGTNTRIACLPTSSCASAALLILGSWSVSWSLAGPAASAGRSSNSCRGSSSWLSKPGGVVGAPGAAVLLFPPPLPSSSPTSYSTPAAASLTPSYMEAEAASLAGAWAGALNRLAMAAASAAGAAARDEEDAVVPSKGLFANPDIRSSSFNVSSAFSGLSASGARCTKLPCL
mmetsp:Transcript_14091/g.30553  ORF Transcript_14091/g.30553 Transcript_14091/m.30553 type:complete len:202 (+) Transcript_14091:366-971(+)